MPGGGTNGAGGTNSSNNGQANESSSPPLPAQFEPNGNWIVYVARIEQYFVAYNITEDGRKRAILLTSLSQDVYELLTDLCFPDLPETKALKDICEILKTHYRPKVSVYAERRKFYDAQQNEGESVADYVARLKGLTRHCKLGDSFNQVLRDKFVCGLLRGPLFNKAMELEPTADLAACIEVIVKKEATLDQNVSTVTESVCYIKSNANPCHVCGDTKHKSQSCKFKSYVCRSCNVKGHLARACNKKSGQTKQAGHHYVDFDEDNQLGYDYSEGVERIT